MEPRAWFYVEALATHAHRSQAGAAMMLERLAAAVRDIGDPPFRFGYREYFSLEHDGLMARYEAIVP